MKKLIGIGLAAVGAIAVSGVIARNQDGTS